MPRLSKVRTAWPAKRKDGTWADQVSWLSARPLIRTMGCLGVEVEVDLGVAEGGECSV